MRILSVTSVKDEGPFVLEWIAWHRMIGVTDFLFVSNDCSDGTDAMLDALAEAGIVTHLRNPCVPPQSLQWQALVTAWQHPLRKTADWMLISDVDEFPMIHVGNSTGTGTLPDLIAACPAETEAIALAWRLFGNAGIARLADAPVTAQFTRSAPPDLHHPVAATYFKSLFRPAAFRRPGVHRPKQTEGHLPRWVDGSGRALPDEFAANDGRLSLYPLHGCRDLAEMHHYSLRSVESFVVKSDRGLPNHRTKPVDLSYWVGRNFNTVANEAARPHLAALAEEIAALRALPGLGDLHARACDWHRARFHHLIRTEPGYRLFVDCLLARDSAALGDTAAHWIYRAFQNLGQSTDQDGTIG